MLLLAALVLLAGCATVPVTGRQQFNLLSEEEEARLGREAYREILAQARLSNDARLVTMVRRVGTRIAAVTNRPEFEWEFNLIESPEQNAFCLPGGKVAVYTGILEAVQNEAGLAAVLGHEIAHAVARHGGERLTENLIISLGAAVLGEATRRKPESTRRALMVAYGAGTTFGVVLPYSRSHELEADRMGLVYMAHAGYDPREAVAFWRRFAAKGGKVPEFLSTHPASERRIAQLEDLIHEALAIYAANPNKYGSGERIASSP